MAQQFEITELQAVDRRRQSVILDLLKADYRRQRQLVEALKIVKSLKTQMIELQRQQGPAKDPAKPELPEEASVDKGMNALFGSAPYQDFMKLSNPYSSGAQKSGMCPDETDKIESTSRRNCPSEEQDQGNGNAVARAYAVGVAGKTKQTNGNGSYRIPLGAKSNFSWRTEHILAIKETGDKSKKKPTCRPRPRNSTDRHNYPEVFPEDFARTKQRSTEEHLKIILGVVERKRSL
ncbi:hypothetical protein Tco_0906466 [Tanacetum coccineum]|uniref:Uncharacterized protein n=1 Tax=Tanacetum coccineum TaxID=301880 RepID=A0ABQ5CJX7_9ASTR